MIGIFGGSGGERGTTGRLLMTYNGLSINNPADTYNDIYEVASVSPNTGLDYVSEVNQQRDGLEVYPFRKVSRIIKVSGVIRAPSVAALHDKIKLLAKLCDPAKIGHENSDPFLAFDFSVPTTDTTNYATGFAASRYYALPLRIPDPVIDYAVGDTAMFDLVLLIKDPRRYLQTQVTQTGSGTIANSKADYRSWPTVTLTMSGAGSATYKIKNTHAYAAPELVLNLSGRANGEVVTIDMEHRKISVNGTEMASLYVSDTAGGYFEIEPGNNIILVTNGSNVSTQVAFRPAFCI